jgi:hypothetical protein
MEETPKPILVSLRAIDVGFDPRPLKMLVVLPRGRVFVVTDDDEGSKTYDGDSEGVVKELQEDGWIAAVFDPDLHDPELTPNG